MIARQKSKKRLNIFMASKKITSLSSTERDRRDVEDRDDVHSVLLTRNDPQQIDSHSQSNREVISLRALSIQHKYAEIAFRAPPIYTAGTLV